MLFSYCTRLLLFLQHFLKLARRARVMASFFTSKLPTFVETFWSPQRKRETQEGDRGACNRAGTGTGTGTGTGRRSSQCRAVQDQGCDCVQSNSTLLLQEEDGQTDGESDLGREGEGGGQHRLRRPRREALTGGRLFSFFCANVGEDNATAAAVLTSEGRPSSAKRPTDPR